MEVPQTRVTAAPGDRNQIKKGKKKKEMKSISMALSLTQEIQYTFDISLLCKNKTNKQKTYSIIFQGLHL